MCLRPFTICLVLAWVVAGTAARGEEPKLLAHWPLAGDARDISGSGQNLKAHGVDFVQPGPKGNAASAAGFNGHSSYLELADASRLALGSGDFSLGIWVHTELALDDVLGDLVSQYDPVTRRGFQLSIQNLAGVTTGQPNHRHLHFGIDQGKLEPSWIDHGRVGSAVFVFALCVHEGSLYAATCEPGANERGGVYRWEGKRSGGKGQWTLVGRPDACNAVSSLASLGGSLYCGTSKYRLGGSSLPESENPHLGGKVFRMEADGKWQLVGELPGVEAIGSLAAFRGQLYASSLYKPAGLFRYDGGTTWASCGTPGGKRVESLAVFNGSLWATGYDEAGIYRYDGERWQHMGKAGAGTQTYGLAVHRGELYVSQWPEARVFRYAGEAGWRDVGRLGNELESMPLVTYNGKLYGGTLPLAEVYRFDGDGQWTNIGRLDHTPDVKYRRAWSMAVFQGRLFCGTLPSGHVHSIEAGKNATVDRELAPGWRHIAAIRRGQRLELFVDGKLAGQSTEFSPADFDVTTTAPLLIGMGAHDYFRGRMADVRLYRGALSPEAIQQAVAQSQPPATWKVGLAKANITPEKSMWLAGYGGRTRPAEGKLHDIWIKALALEDAKGYRVVLLTSDLCGLPKWMYDSVCKQLEAKHGLKREQIRLTNSHNHCAPAVRGELEDYYPLDDAQRRSVYEYSDWLKDQIVATIDRALASFQPAKLSAGEGLCTFAVNRRNNREADIPALLARGEMPKGPVDHTVPVLAVRGGDEKLLAVVFGYACHNTTLDFYQWCGDYAGFAQIALERQHSGALALFVDGCGGDQNPLPRRTVELCERYGNQLADSVTSVLVRPMRPLSPTTKAAFEFVDLPFDKNPTREELEEHTKGTNAIRSRWAKRMLRQLDEGKPFAKSQPYAVQVWRLGDQLWIALGGEALVDYSLRFRADYGERTWTTSYAHDLTAYIPSRRNWLEGGYEVAYLHEYLLPADRWAGDVEERIAAAIERLVVQVGGK